MNRFYKLMNSSFVLLLIFFVLLKPGSFSEYVAWKKIGDIINIIRIFVCLWCLLYFFLKRVKIDKFISFVVLFYLSLLFSTFYFGQTYVNLLFEFASILSWIVLFKTNIFNNKKKFFTNLENMFLFLLTINLITIILFPGGFYLNSSGYSSNYFLGYDNNLITYIFPALALSFTNSYGETGKVGLKSIYLLIISLLSILLTWSATGVAAILIITFLFSIYTFKKRDFPINKYIIIVLILFVCIVLLRVQNVLSFIIEGWLKKDLTFTGRTYIWDIFIEQIKQSLLIGHGIVDYKYLIRSINAGHAHDYFLQILYQGGVVALSMFLGFFFTSINKMRDSKQKKYVGIIIFAYLISFIFEAYTLTSMFIIVLLISYYYEPSLKEEKGDNSEIINN